LRAKKLEIYRAAPMCTDQRAVSWHVNILPDVKTPAKLFIFISNDVMNLWERKTTSSM
jgi:hypothetical protein